MKFLASLSLESLKNRKVKLLLGHKTIPSKNAEVVQLCQFWNYFTKFSVNKFILKERFSTECQKLSSGYFAFGLSYLLNTEILLTLPLPRVTYWLLLCLTPDDFTRQREIPWE